MRQRRAVKGDGQHRLDGAVRSAHMAGLPKTQAHDDSPAQGPVALRRAHPARPCRPRPARAARLRQHADLSRLDGALSDAPTTSSTGAAATPTAPRARRRRKRSRAPGRDLAGAAGTVLAPSGLAAVTLALMSCLKAGDHLLVTDSVYRPTRQFCDGVLKALRRRDDLLRPADRRRHRGAAAARTPRRSSPRRPGSQILRDAGHPGHRRGRRTGTAPSCSWTTPGRRRCSSRRTSAASTSRSRPAPNICRGNSDLLLGLVSANARAWPALRRTFDSFAMCAGPGGRLPGAARPAHHGAAPARSTSSRRSTWRAGSRRARRSPRVLHPALESDPGHAIWKRDFKGSSGLFSIVLEPGAEGRRGGDARRPRAVRDGLFLGRLREPRRSRSTAPPTAPPRAGIRRGPAVRLHIGLEDLDDLKADLDAGFARLRREAAKAA